MAFNSCFQVSALPPKGPDPATPCLQQLLIELDIERSQTASLLQQLSMSQRRVHELQLRTKQLEALASLQCLYDPASELLAGEEDRSSTAEVGKYPAAVRREKIAKYKAKIRKYRSRVGVSRLFQGRSRVARQKLRANGRFLKLPISP
jgi:hypothetical protein